MTRRTLRRPGKWLLIPFLGALGLVVVFLAVQNRNAARRAADAKREQEEQAALAQARSFLEKGEPPRAIRAVARIPQSSAHHAEGLTIKGLALAALQETGPARQVLEEAWRLHPNGDAARVLAAIYLSANENERGLQMLLEASRLEPDDFRPWYAMGESVYLRLQRYDRAIDAFHESLKRQPDHVESQIGLIETLLRTHRIEEATPWVARVSGKRPDDPRVLALTGEFAMESGDKERAARDLERALALDPDHRQALILHARLLFGQGRRREALPEAERACSLDPNDVSTLTLLSTIQTSLGLREEAEKTLALKDQVKQRTELMEKLSREIMEHPELPEPRWRLGQLALQGNMTSLAIQSYLGALAQAPSYEPARRALLDLGFPPSRLPAPQSKPAAANPK